MNQLDQNAYKLLLIAKGDVVKEIALSEEANWYQLTYEIFINAPLENINDLWKIVAFAYSWMPRIPKIKSHLINDPAALLFKLKELKNGDTSYLKNLLHELVPVINNSLTGTSKVLHFIAPQTVPIIDKNVLWGWNVFFFHANQNYDVVSLPHYKTALNINHVSHYLQYRDILLQWVANCESKVSLRQLESALFELGRKVPEPQRVYNLTA